VSLNLVIYESVILPTQRPPLIIRITRPPWVRKA